MLLPFLNEIFCGTSRIASHTACIKSQGHTVNSGLHLRENLKIFTLTKFYPTRIVNEKEIMEKTLL